MQMNVQYAFFLIICIHFPNVRLYSVAVASISKLASWPSKFTTGPHLWGQWFDPLGILLGKLGTVRQTFYAAYSGDPDVNSTQTLALADTATKHLSHTARQYTSLSCVSLPRFLPSCFLSLPYS